ncbi:MAG TPA: GntR family transcriptional regulator [Capillimicrobium sp.]|nr:GntR family transcriptional regulator [Capillimicrobium sp.]
MTRIVDNPDDDCYGRLRAAIVSGELQPNERLVELELSERLGLGRAAIRTALVRLEADGLVERERNRGAKVRMVGQREASEILEARAVLEGLAARHAALHATDDDIARLREILGRMRELLDAGDLVGASDEQAILHRTIGEMSGHGTALRLISGLRSQVVRYQYRTILVPGRPGESFEEHSAIVEAIAAGDPDAAEDAMRRHLANVAGTLPAEVRGA